MGDTRPFLNFDLASVNEIDWWFRNEIHRLGATVTRTLSWTAETPTDWRAIEDDYRFVIGDDVRRHVFVGSTSVAHVMHNSSTREVEARIAGQSEDDCDELVACLQRVFVPRPPREDEVEVEFTYLDTQGEAHFHPRHVGVPTWSAIRDNYSAVITDELDRLMDRFDPNTGRVLLWHGEAGVGKTFAIRALLHSWRHWCSPMYVVDPERFFSESAYMFEALMRVPGDEHRYRLVILEDTGEMITADARERTGQGLSRLLNLSDGLLGQGLNVLVLLTTNEDVHRLHPAIRRAGRTSSVLDFPHLRPDEARRWLTRHGRTDVTVNEPKRLSDLYALVSDARTDEETPTVGHYL